LREEKRNLLILAILSVLLLVLPNGLYSAFDKDEPKYLEAAWEMVKSSDYITPYYNYEYRFDKPVLVYWLIAGGYLLFGVNEFGGRLFVSLFGVFTVLLLYLWVRRWKGERLAYTSALVLLTLLDFIVMASVAMPDIVLTFFISASLVAFFEGYHRKSKNYYRLAFLSAGLATLTKGPVGLVLPGIVATLYLAFRRELVKTFKEEIPWLSGILIYLAVVLPWYGAVFLKHGRQFFLDFIVFHNIHRFTNKIPGHPTEWWYYLANYFWLYLPWTFFFPFALKKLIKDKKSITEPLVSFSLIWFFTVLLFFQIAHTKLAHYLLPSFPPFALLTAWYITEEREKAPYLLTLITFIVLGIAGLAFWLYKGWPLYALLFVLPSIVGAAVAFKKLEPRAIAYGFLLTMLLFKWLTLPSLEPLRAKPAVGREVSKLKEECPECKVYFLSYKSPEIVFYYRKGKIEDVGAKEAKRLLSGKEPVIIITRENRLKRIEGANYHVLDKRKELITKHSIVVISNREFKEWKGQESSQ